MFPSYLRVLVGILMRALVTPETYFGLGFAAVALIGSRLFDFNTAYMDALYIATAIGWTVACGVAWGGHNALNTSRSTREEFKSNRGFSIFWAVWSVYTIAAIVEAVFFTPNPGDWLLVVLAPLAAGIVSLKSPDVRSDLMVFFAKVIVPDHLSTRDIPATKE